jgi:hypothetical protein
MPSFERDIKPLFREQDRAAMEYWGDLWSYDDVKEEATTVLERLEDLSMPCDEPWDAERISLFRDWVEQGCEP